MALHPREVRPPGQASIRGKWGLGLQQASRLWRTGLPACKPASQHQPACSTGRERGSGPPPGRPAHLLGGGEGPPGNGVCAGGGGLAVRVALTAVAAANVGGSVQVGQGCGRAGQGGGGGGGGGEAAGARAPGHGRSPRSGGVRTGGCAHWGWRHCFWSHQGWKAGPRRCGASGPEQASHGVHAWPARPAGLGRTAGRCGGRGAAAVQAAAAG